MAKFLFVSRSEKGTRESLSPEEMQRAHQQWQAWIAKGLQEGWMLDAGHGLKTGYSSQYPRMWDLRP
ncbi:MAG TPA: hypothetical protein VKE40_08630 [Gemmataceae bacterium]|nr:hypothetical protein [Gemmataceae bacterium]